MNWAMKIIPVVALAAVVATPASAKTKHVRHHASYYRVVPNGYAYNPADPAGPPQRPIYANGQMIGRANDANIRDQIEAQYYLDHYGR